MVDVGSLDMQNASRNQELILYTVRYGVRGSASEESHAKALGRKEDAKKSVLPSLRCAFAPWREVLLSARLQAGFVRAIRSLEGATGLGR